MDVKFLGTGGAFNFEYGNSAAWIKINQLHILLDCGHTVYPVLRDKNLIDKIDYILITHLHDDHVGSLCSTILHHTYGMNPPRKAKLLIPDQKFDDIMKKFLVYGLNTPEDYVEFHSLDEVEGIQAIDTFGLHVKDVQSYGYIFEDEDEVVLFSGDLGHPTLIVEHARKIKNKPVRIFHEMSFEQTDGVHVYYEDLFPVVGEVPIFAYHINHHIVPPNNIVPLVAEHKDLLI
ncbi:MAG: MBL fold metallo-hydrolase [Bacteroidota bacterium]